MMAYYWVCCKKKHDYDHKYSSVRRQEKALPSLERVTLATWFK